MREQFAARSLSLDALLSDPFLIDVPAYQRPYSWTPDHADRLIEETFRALDLAIAAPGDGEVLLGTMLFVDCDTTVAPDGWPWAGPARTFEVVDGLQRLVTLTIMICVLRDLLAAAGTRDGELPAHWIGPAGGGRRRLAMRPSDGLFLADFVQAPGATALMPDRETLSVAEERMLAVREHFRAVLGAIEPERCRQIVRFLQTQCHVIAVVTYGVDRAHRMFMVLNETGKPLARNDILKAELLGAAAPASRARLLEAWTEAEAILGDNFEPLFSHIRAMYGRSPNHVVAGIRAIVAEVGAEAFVETILTPAARAFADIVGERHDGTPQSPRIAAYLTYLNRLPGGEWVAPAMLWWLAPNRTPAELEWFLQRLDRLAYGMRLLGLGFDKRSQRFARLMAAIRSGEALDGPASPLNFTREEQRSMLYNLRDLHARSPQTCRLVLLRLNDAIAGRDPDGPTTDLTVEHVLPRKPSPASQWRKWFPDAQDRERCTGSIGNLVLVPKAHNDRARNYDLARKKEIFFAADAAGIALNSYLRDKSEWRAAEILAREADLIARVMSLWNLGDGERSEERNGPGDSVTGRWLRRA